MKNMAGSKQLCKKADVHNIPSKITLSVAFSSF